MPPKGLSHVQQGNRSAKVLNGKFKLANNLGILWASHFSYLQGHLTFEKEGVMLPYLPQKD
jgi:hypothetical protein